MTSKPHLRAGGDEERPSPAFPMSLMDAVESGDVLAILLAQRRLIAESLSTSTDNTRPQLNNELNKLHALITAEEARRAVEETGSQRAGTGERRSFNAAAI